MMNQTMNETTSTTTTEDRDLAIASLIVRHSRIADAATELEFARKQIDQVSICHHSLLHAGLSNEEATSFLKSLRSIEQAIASAASRARCNAMEAREELFDLVDGFSK